MNTVAIDTLGFSLHWYAVAYFAGFAAIYINARARQPTNVPLNRANLLQLTTWLAIGVLLGSRTLYVFGHRPITASALFDTGGMSSYGAFIGAALAIFLFSRLRGLPSLVIADLVALGAPLGIAFVRLANFLNGDLPQVVDAYLLQIPVPVIEAVVQGVLPLLALNILASKTSILNQPGRLTGVFLCIYGTGRFSAEFLRNNEANLFGNAALMSIGLIILGFYLFLNAAASRKYKEFKPSTTAHRPYVSSIICITGYITLTGCGSGPPVIPPPTAVPVTIVPTNPNGDPNCPCQNSAGVYAENRSNTPKSIRWTIYTRDTLADTNLTPIPGSGQVPAQNAAGAAGRLYLGCTIHAPGTSCRFQAKYSLTSVQRILGTERENSVLFGLPTAPSIATCRDWCMDPSNPNAGACLPLGQRFMSTIAPLVGLFGNLPPDGGKVTKAEIAKAFNRPESDDKCDRGDVFSANGKIFNEARVASPKYCPTQSEPLDSGTLTFLRANKIRTSAQMGMQGFIPNRIEATPMPATKGVSSDRFVVFESVETAPLFAFTGDGGDELTHLFGGALLGAAREKSRSGEVFYILATSNGCVSVSEPPRK